VRSTPPEEALSGGELKNGVEVSGWPSEGCILIAQEQEKGFLPFLLSVNL
jgi:hypothetical protein